MTEVSKRWVVDVTFSECKQTSNRWLNFLIKKFIQLHFSFQGTRQENTLNTLDRESTPFLAIWVRTQKAMVIYLSNGTMQVIITTCTVSFASFIFFSSGTNSIFLILILFQREIFFDNLQRLHAILSLYRSFFSFQYFRLKVTFFLDDNS